MKKPLYLLVPIILFVSSFSVAFAQAVPANGSLSAGGDCEQNAQACGSGLICQTNANADDTCVAASGNTGQISCDVGSVTAGQSCVACSDGTNADTAADCPGGAAATGAAAPTAAAPAATGAGGTNNFVSLSQFPAFTGGGGLINSSQAVSLSTFFNNLYKICIGIAAALALLQIMRAGFTWMTAGDNTEQVSHARSLISTSVFGLILVLSPYIVFSIINPAILNLNPNFTNLSGSGTTAGAAGTTAAAGTATTPAGPTVAGTGQGQGTVPNGSACTSSADCSGGNECSAAKQICQPDNGLAEGGDACTQTADCDGNLVCDENSMTCQDPNGAGISEVGEGLGNVGQNGPCNSSADCQGDLECNAGSQTCQPDNGLSEQGDECSSSNECDGDLVCDANSMTCQPPENAGVVDTEDSGDSTDNSNGGN